MPTNEEIVLSYRKHENLFEVSKALDIPWQTVYWKLKKLGEPVIGNKSRWGSPSDKFASKGEMEFHRLVPFAVDCNKNSFQAKVDFIVNGYSVDIKCSTPKQISSKTSVLSYAFHIKKQIRTADFWVLFGYSDDRSKIMNTYLVPRDMINKIQTITISIKGHSKWSAFEVNPDDLCDFFVNLGEKGKQEKL